MDVKGAKPVAGRIKQTPLGANINDAQFGGRRAPRFVKWCPDTNRSRVSTTGGHRTLPVGQEGHLSQQYELPTYHPPEHPSRVVRKRSKRRNLILRTIAMSFVVLLTLAGLLIWNGYIKFHRVFHGTSVVAALTSRPGAAKNVIGQNDGRVNILLLGVDGPGHAEADVTSSIVLLSVDPVNNTATLLSIPPDLWVRQPMPYLARQQEISAVYKYGKYSYLDRSAVSDTNAAAMQAGFEGLDQIVERMTGLAVNYHILVNFQAFEQAVDGLGGITLNVPRALEDSTLASVNGGNPTLAEPGIHHMNGSESLLYARSSRTTSNFASGQRQLQLLIALKDKMLSTGTLSDPSKLEALINAFGDNVYSDLSVQGAERLYSILGNIEDKGITPIDLGDPTYRLLVTATVDGGQVELPVAGSDDYSLIRTFIHSRLPDGYIVYERAPITILSGTASGAAITGDFLRGYGYDVVATAASARRMPKLTLVDLSRGSDPYTLRYLENHYNVKAVNSIPPGENISAGGSKFVIIEP